MNSITLDISSNDSITQGIGMLQRLLGNALPSAKVPAPAASTGTAPAGAARGPTGGASSPAAASAVGPSQASTAATGEQGNGAGSAGPGASATTASSNTPALSPAEAFDAVKKPFLALSNKKGRPACEAVLAEFKLAKLSEAKPEQYAALAAAIAKASA